MKNNRSNIGTFVGGAILIAFGLLSLAGQLFRTLDWSFLWSTVIILMGGCFFVAMFVIGKGASALAIPGSIVSGIGLVMLIQSITHHWESMSYFWTLIILFIGIGIYIMGWHAGDENQKRAGTRVIRAGMILFVIFGAFFELMFSNLNNIIFPILFIGVGIYLVLTRSGLLGSKKRESTDPLPPTS